MSLERESVGSLLVTVPHEAVMLRGVYNDLLDEPHKYLLSVVPGDGYKSNVERDDGGR